MSIHSSCCFVFLHTDSYLIFLIQGAVVSSNTVVELTVRPGENVTLYCDCKRSPGENIVWYRKCSHENQPLFILTWNSGYRSPHLNVMWNNFSQSYTLLITNITDSQLGLYYCQTKEQYVIDQDQEYKQRYGNVTTRISFGKLTLHRFL